MEGKRRGSEWATYTLSRCSATATVCSSFSAGFANRSSVPLKGKRRGCAGPPCKWIEWLVVERDELLRLAREGGPEKDRPEGRRQVNRDGS